MNLRFHTCLSLLLLPATLLVLTPALHAQWLGTLSLESGYDDNMFRNYSASSGASTDLSLMYGFFPQDRNWALNYSGTLTSFASYPDRLYSTQSVGASWALPLGDDARNSLTFMGVGSLRLDGADYALYDYSQAMFTASLRQQMTAELPLFASYRLRYRNYQNFGELSYLEHVASLGTMVFFESRTSVRVQADFGFKNYLNTNIVASDAGFNGVAPTGSALTVNDGGNGNGGGNTGGGPGGSTSGNGWGGGSGRMSIGDGGPGRGMEGSVEYLVYEEPSTSQLSTWINIGQGITESTGLSVRFLQRWNLTDRGRAFIGGAVDFIGEEELFDDPYSYESSEGTLTITQVLPWSMKLKTGAYYLHKTYGYPASLDDSDPTAPSRTDDRMGGWLTLSKSLTGNWLLFDGLELTLGYVYLRNQSNTTYYDFSSNAVTIGLSTDF